MQPTTAGLFSCMVPSLPNPYDGTGICMDWNLEGVHIEVVLKITLDCSSHCLHCLQEVTLK